MASSVNKVILIGNLGRNPEVRRTSDGLKIVSLSLATSESWRDKSSGELKERTEWHKVVIINEHLCEIAEKYLKKGSKVYVEGQLQTKKWTDLQGQERYTPEVLISRFKGDLSFFDNRLGEEKSSDYKSHSSSTSENSVPKSNTNFTDIDDNIPF